MSAAILAGCTSGSGGLGTSAATSVDEQVALDLDLGTVVPVTGTSADPVHRRQRILFRRIAAASAVLGRPAADNLSEADERPERSVGHGGFLIAVFELDQWQWRRMSGDAPWSGVAADAGDDLPAVGMSREDVAAICARWSPPGWSLALPTPEQWEVACRAGSRGIFSWGDGFDEDAAVVWRDGGTLAPLAVGSRKANAFGLHDMHGNVWEFTAGDEVRGGAFDQPLLQARASNHLKVGRDIGLRTVGVRLVLMRSGS